MDIVVLVAFCIMFLALVVEIWCLEKKIANLKTSFQLDTDRGEVYVLGNEEIKVYSMGGEPKGSWKLEEKEVMQKMVGYEIKTAKCNICGKTGEAVIFKRRRWVFAIQRMTVCQSCVAKAFRGFQRGV